MNNKNEYIKIFADKNDLICIIKELKTGKLFVEIENYIYLKDIDECITHYNELKTLIETEFKIFNIETVEEVSYTLIYDEEEGHYCINIKEFKVSSIENLIEKINYVISNLKINYINN